MYEELLGKRFNSVQFIKIGQDTYGKLTGNGVESLYKLSPAPFEAKAEAVLMDLDGTTLTSEEFWIYIIEKVVQKFMGNPTFTFEEKDIPYVSGYSTVEHLEYVIRTYIPELKLNDALLSYHNITEVELDKIMHGEGYTGAFKPTEGLKEFLTALKGNHVKIGLCTSGLDYKAIPEIVAVFKELKMGNPLEFYDAIITGGHRKDTHEYGTLGEIAVKPHPWLYTELAYMGLNIQNSMHVMGIEDSSAGVMALRFAGFPVCGLNSGNIGNAGLDCLCHKKVDKLDEILKIVLGKQVR